MTIRYQTWFTIDPPVPASGLARATYNGGDAIGEGTVGRRYNVTILGGNKLDAPNPPFLTPEGPTIPRSGRKTAPTKKAKPSTKGTVAKKVSPAKKSALKQKPKVSPAKALPKTKTGKPR